MNLRTTICTTAIMLFTFYGLLYLHVLPNGKPLNAKQTLNSILLTWNRIETNPELAIVGTSRASSLYAEYFDVPVVNLAIPGDSALTGLAIIVRSPITPKILLVEASSISMRKMENNAVNNAPTDQVERLWKEFTDCSVQPVGVLRACRWPPGSDQEKLAPADRKAMQSMVLGGGYLPKVVANESKFQAVLVHAKAMIDRLTKRGSRVILFDTPSDPTVLTSLRKYDDRVRLTFPVGEYEWLRDDSRSWEMRDVTHLTNSAASQFAKSTERRLRQIGALPDTSRCIQM